MNDSTIIKIISKTYFIILSLLTFIFLTFTFIFILLQNGLHIKELSVSNLKIEQLYIKWDQKVDVSIKEILIVSKKETNDDKLDYKLLSSYIKALQHTTNWFESIAIEKIKFKELEISFAYKDDSKGFVIVRGDSLKATASITYNQDILNIAIEEFYERTKNISLYGNIYLDLDDQQLFAHIQSSINNDANLDFYSTVDAQDLYFNIKSKNDIKDVIALIKLASLPKEIKFWTQDAIKVQSMTIESLKGHIDFQNPENTLKNIYVKAKANKLDYTYNTNLDAVHTAYTDLEFKDGVLFIRPRKAFSFKSSLGESWLKIDFTKKEELLTLHLLFDAQLDSSILKILKTYNIDLPFLQKSGSIHTDLILAVNLMSIDVDAKGSFYTKKANFDYLGLNIDIFETTIVLDNYDVKIDKMRAHYKDIAKADVKVAYNAKTSEGKLDFKFDQIALQELQLKNKTPQIDVSYKISPKKDLISVAQSNWAIGEHTLFVEAIEVPFDLNTRKLTLPTTFLELQGISSAFLQGSIDLKNFKTDLLLDVLTLSYEGLKFSQSNTPIKIKYDKNLSVHSPEDLFFNISGTEYKLDKPTLLLEEKNLTLKNTKLTMGHYATTKIYAKHNLQTSKAHISLSDFVITNYKQDKTLYKKKKILLSIENQENELKISSKELETTISSDKNGWKIHVNSLAQLSNNSELLEKFHLNNGNFTLYKNKDDKYVKFTSKLTYPYKLLTQNDKPTKEYDIKGELKNEAISLSVNKNTSVNIADTIKIKTKNTGINVEEILKLVENFKGFETDKSNKKLNIQLNARDSYLYLSESRRIVSELIDLQFTNEILTAQLKHDKGSAGLRLYQNQFHLYGKNFNEEFMHQLFSLSKFKGGRLDFSLDGTLEEFNGVFHISDSTIMDYKLMNNILAFINTVPSLVTFSLPGYSDNGLYAKQAYANFVSKDGVLNISDIYLESKELNILGNGVVNPKEDTIDLKLNLKTDLGSDASKIPLVGYILFDKESVSTTLKITGKLSNPSINTMIARDIVVAPLNIIKRTIGLPYNILKSFGRDENKSK